MTYEVVVTAAAKQNLRAAYLWAAERAPLTAAAWLNRFETELDTLSTFPERCALAPEDALVAEEIRQLIFGRRQAAYRALFTIADNQVRVLHIRRAVRDLATRDELNLP
jgi:plasmid stabilization system protein ParE